MKGIMKGWSTEQSPVDHTVVRINILTTTFKRIGGLLDGAVVLPTFRKIAKLSYQRVTSPRINSLRNVNVKQ